jgi:hypothetical protein
LLACRQAQRTLPVLMTASDMMICGEDLGMIPSCVHPVMADLGLIGASAACVLHAVPAWPPRMWPCRQLPGPACTLAAAACVDEYRACGCALHARRCCRPADTADAVGA